MSERTVKCLWRLANDPAKYMNLPVRVDRTRSGTSYVGIRVGGTGNYLSLRADEARKLADHLHDRADQVDELNRKGNR